MLLKNAIFNITSNVFVQKKYECVCVFCVCLCVYMCVLSVYECVSAY